MRTTTRILATGALSLPLALGLSGVAAADTGVSVEGTDRPASTVTVQAEDERANSTFETNDETEDDGFTADLNIDGLLSDDDEDGNDGLLDIDGDDENDNEDDGILSDIL